MKVIISKVFLFDFSIFSNGESPIGPKLFCVCVKVSRLIIITNAANPNPTFHLKCSGTNDCHKDPSATAIQM